MDGNIQIEDSATLTAVLRGSDLVDVAAGLAFAQTTTMTYQAGGIKARYLEGTDTSAIVHILTNEAGFLSVRTLKYSWDYAISHNLDHVPLELGLTDKAYT